MTSSISTPTGATIIRVMQAMHEIEAARHADRRAQHQ